MSSALLSSLSTQSQSPIPNATSFNHSSTIPLFAAHPVHPVPLQVVSAYLCKCELPSTVLLLLLVMSHCNEVDWSAATQRHSSQSKNNNLTAQAVCVPVPSEVDKQQLRTKSQKETPPQQPAVPVTIHSRSVASSVVSHVCTVQGITKQSTAVRGHHTYAVNTEKGKQ